MAVVATGFFDGVHSGHRRVIETLLSEASARGEESIAVTFSQHPRAVLQHGARELRLLNSMTEKLSILRSLGVDRIETVDFTPEFASLPAESYLKDYLVGRFGATELVLGYDNRLGSDGLRPQQISSLAASLGLDALTVPPYAPDGFPISSTMIRRTLAQGDVRAAASMLGYTYSVSGVVVPGFQRGRTVGFPTANLGLSDPLKLLPSAGAYFTVARLGTSCYESMTNIDPSGKIETHIFEFGKNIYGLEIEIFFIMKIRDEKTIVSDEQLSEQLQEDRKQCAKISGKLKVNAKDMIIYSAINDPKFKEL